MPLMVCAPPPTRPSAPPPSKTAVFPKTFPAALKPAIDNNVASAGFQFPLAASVNGVVKILVIPLNAVIAISLPLNLPSSLPSVSI